MSVITYKCPNCGGELKFDPESQKYHCEYCLTDFSQETVEKLEPDRGEEQQAQEQSGGAVVYSCPSCGAQIVTEETTAATFCYYCHNPVVLSGRLEGEYLPDAIIPFGIGREQALQAFEKFVKSRHFVPRSFYQKEQVEKLTGVYFPFWSCSCSLKGSMEAAATNVRIWRVGDIEYTETKNYQIFRDGQLDFPDMTKNALHKANRMLVEAVQPFDLKKAQPFSMAYLSGFQAEKRDMEQGSFREEFQEDCRRYTREMLLETVSGYASVTPGNTQVEMEEEDWRYLLLPVWVLTYRGKDNRLYYYAMNGQNGKTAGDLPTDIPKAAIFSGVLALVVLILFLIGGYLI